MHQAKIYHLAILLVSGLFPSALTAPSSYVIKRTPQPQGTSELDPSELVVIPIDDGTPTAEPDPITVAPSTDGSGSGGGGVGGSGGTGTDTGGSNGVSAPGLVAVRRIHTSVGTGKRTPHPEPRPQTEGVTSSSASNTAGLDPSELVVIPIDDPALPPVDTSGVTAGFKVRARTAKKTC